MTTLSCTMITYNEGEFLYHNLPRLVEFCDQIVIVDMESTDDSQRLFARYLRPRDILLSYRRENLFNFGFSHPRNFAAAHADSDWLFALDADEIPPMESFRSALENAPPDIKVFDLERRNYHFEANLTLSDLMVRRFSDVPFSSERHRRIYRRTPQISFEGVIHEELWAGEASAYFSAAPLNICIHHVHAYRTRPTSGLKDELYAYLTLKAFAFPAFRRGTNDWWFNEYALENIDLLIERANKFAVVYNLPIIPAHSIQKQQEILRVGFL